MPWQMFNAYWHFKDQPFALYLKFYKCTTKEYLINNMLLLIHHWTSHLYCMVKMISSSVFWPFVKDRRSRILHITRPGLKIIFLPLSRTRQRGSSGILNDRRTHIKYFSTASTSWTVIATMVGLLKSERTIPELISLQEILRVQGFPGLIAFFT